MRNDLADITLIVDRSGSMVTIKNDAQGGINNFIDEQKKLPGSAIFSLLQFDTEYEWYWKNTDIKSIYNEYVLNPRGGTALLDAVGRCINETGARLSKMPEDKRPGLVIIAIVTDGEENSSKEFTKKQIKDMITHQQTFYNWQFTFLGANQDAFHEAAQLGIYRGATLNFDIGKSIGSYTVLTSNVSRMRNANLTGDIINNCYTDEERTSVS